MPILAYNEVVRDRPRGLVWLGDTLDVLRRFPVGVRQRLGFALYEAQVGLKHESAKPLQGFDTLVWQVRADHPSGTYRAVYLVQFQDAVYVLHAFQKKSKSGISTSQRDIETIRQRLRIARRKVAQGGS